jgi:hypothetical protein
MAQPVGVEAGVGDAADAGGNAAAAAASGVATNTFLVRLRLADLFKT